MRFKFIWMSLLFSVLACASHKKTTPPVQASTPSAAPVVSQTPSTPSPTGQKVESASNAVTCKRGSEERVIDIEALQPKGCKLWYTRDGKKNATASSEKGPGHCESVHDRIRGKLEAADFKCSGGPAIATAAPASPAVKSKPKATADKKESIPSSPALDKAKPQTENSPKPASPATKVQPAKETSDSGKKI